MLVVTTALTGAPGPPSTARTGEGDWLELLVLETGAVLLACLQHLVHWLPAGGRGWGSSQGWGRGAVGVLQHLVDRGMWADQLPGTALLLEHVVDGLLRLRPFLWADWLLEGVVDGLLLLLLLLGVSHQRRGLSGWGGLALHAVPPPSPHPGGGASTLGASHLLALARLPGHLGVGQGAGMCHAPHHGGGLSARV